RLAASLAVSWGWNFVLQRNFVYRPTAFDQYAIRLVDMILRYDRLVALGNKKSDSGKPSRP
ncbi:MAG: hypothetical protein K2G72_01035, partial [Duncaniella sp.]|nr:hypothetical protein [Duncaniella sp.]